MKSNESTLRRIVSSIADTVRYSGFMPNISKTGGRPPVLPPAAMVAALTWHVIQPQGKLSQSLEQMHGIRMSDSSLSERRQAMGPGPWAKAAEAVLGAMRRYGADFRYKGYRLVGVDGTKFDVTNTPTMKRVAKKSSNNRGESAFYRISCTALCDLATHSALGIRIGLEDESEAVLARLVLEFLEEWDLLIGDRYYGNGKMVAYLLALEFKPAFLLRVVERNRFNREKRLSDGSYIGNVLNLQTKTWLRIREVCGKVRRPGNDWTEVRFWTNLVDEKKYPAEEIIRLYAYRWEQEIAFREIKAHINDATFLASQTPVTAAQEIFALFMAQSVITSIRIEVGEKVGIPPLQISFKKALDACRKTCATLATMDGIVADHVLDQIGLSLERTLEWTASGKRRLRACPRKVRVPVGSWPRLRENSYASGEIEIQINV